jgi:hypothetical protein
MSFLVATVIWAVVLCMGIVVWGLGLWFWWATFQRRTTEPAHGQIEVRLRPVEASEAVARKLANGAQGLFGRIESADERELHARVSFQPFLGGRRSRLGRSPDGHPSGLPIGPGADLDVAFEPTASGTRLSWTLGRSGGSGFFRMLALGFLLLELVIIAAAAVLIPLYVLPNEEVAIRAQAVQTVQIVHFLWPPFVFTAIARILRGYVENSVNNAFRNLPWMLEATKSPEGDRG